MKFLARVLDQKNAVQQLVIDAPNRADAMAQLRQQSMQVLDLRTVRAPLLQGQNGQFGLLLFCQELEALLKAGLTLMEALHGLVEKERFGAARSLLSSIIASLQGGQTLSKTLAAFPHQFPPLFIGLIKAAETTGNLAPALHRYIQYRQRADNVRDKIISASIYPCILMLVGLGVAMFLGVYVVPKFSAIYKDSGRELPFLSRLLLDWGQFAARHSLLVLASLAGGAGGLLWGMRKAVQTGLLQKWLTTSPTIGPWLRLYELSRLYLTLGMLLESGLSVVSALSMSEGVVSPGTAKLLQTAQSRIASGASFSDTFERLDLTTSISSRMLRVGERSGQLSAMLMQASMFYDNDISRFIDRFTRAFEPALMALIGIVIGGIVVLLYLPIFDLASSLQ